MENGVALMQLQAIVIFLLSSAQGVAGGGVSCDKFQGQSNRITGTIGDVCYYTFDTSKTWTEAVQLCESEGTHLVHVKTASDQSAVNILTLGITQYWTGLFKEGVPWLWRVDASNTILADIDGSRWETSSTYSPITCVTTSGDKLKTHPKTSSAKVVCQDDNAQTGGSVTTTSPPAAATTTALAFTTQPLAGYRIPAVLVFVICFWQRMGGADRWGYFHRQASLTVPGGALAELTAVSKAQCALRCVYKAASGCRHFAFQPSALWCQLYDDGLVSLPCMADAVCYTKMY